MLHLGSSKHIKSKCIHHISWYRCDTLLSSSKSRADIQYVLVILPAKDGSGTTQPMTHQHALTQIPSDHKTQSLSLHAASHNLCMHLPVHGVTSFHYPNYSLPNHVDYVAMRKPIIGYFLCHGGNVACVNTPITSVSNVGIAWYAIGEDSEAIRRGMLQEGNLQKPALFGQSPVWFLKLWKTFVGKHCMFYNFSC